MVTYRVRASGTVEAEPGLVHRIIANYKEGHPNILSKKYFSPLTIEEGGFGAGTTLRFSMKALGRAQSFHLT
ncbi:MAG TPA: hypothetical protein DEP53_17535 [Bacteroidetes bacterium]|nr:MAG: hypothetical protein A2X66_02605 [Ignavibacteria bacterium GWA2_54_16]HCA81537.1 hypothetical protein [Bacteroidota bacterium]